LTRDPLPPEEDGLERVAAPDRATWRAWLEEHGETAPAVWLVYFKKGSGTPSITWSEAVEEALCFGWIDSKAKAIDERSYRQYFSPRKPKSGWSKINKASVERLIAAGLMRELGLRAIEIAKANGAWTSLDDIEALVIPDDLDAAFAAAPGAREGFDGLSRGTRRGILHWIASAKRDQTRANRIAATVAATLEGRSPGRF
jgi:uncharacterized protein YdeI (YjbR/CyaY-like superfamily)